VHCLRLTGKYMAGVTTSGGGAGDPVQTWLQHYGNTVGAQFVGGVDAVVPLKESDSAAAKKLGEELVAAIRKKKIYRAQALVIETHKERFAKIIASRKNHWPYEHEYWNGKGWL
jgi:hypothetical protein